MVIALSALVLLGGVFSPANAADGIITTVAGSGVPDANGWIQGGFSGDGGPSTSAQLNIASTMVCGKIAVDSVGNLYIADKHNDLIRKVSTNGIISTVAGSAAVNASGYMDGGFSGDGGPATSAQLNFPIGIAVDSSGNLYFADTQNHRIRKVSTNGIISTVAGSAAVNASGYMDGGFSGDGGPATSAQLNVPSGIAVDSSGNLYIADVENQRIRKVATNGIITTVAGSGAVNSSGRVDGGFSGDGGLATGAQFRYPTDVAVDTIGNIYIADGFNNRIRKVTFPTQIINLSGNLAFGNVTVGTTSTKTLTISNTGDSPLTVTSISYSYPADFSGNWSGIIPAGGSQSVTVTFTPTAVYSYTGTLTVNSDRTGGVNTIAISGIGITASSAILTIDDASAIQGKTNAAVRVSLNNSGTAAVSSMQFDIRYNATAGIHANGSYTLSSRTTGFTVSVTPYENGANSKATVLVYKLSGSIAPGTGAIADILFNVDSGAAVGTSTLSLNNCVLSDIAANRITSTCTDTAVFKVEPACGSPGDINKDGSINVLDLQMLINCIMGRGACNCCDLNSDSSYNIFDLQTLINKIIAAVSGRSVRDNGNNTLKLPVIKAYKSNAGSFGLSLTNESVVSGGQFVFTYDSTTGFDITEVSLTSRTAAFSRDMEIDKADPKNVKVTVLLYSMGKTVTPGSGDILEFVYTTSANATGNTALTFAINLLSDSGAQPLTVSPQNGSVTISDAIAGDVNGSGGTPDLTDAIVALRVIAGLNPPSVFASADVNSDNKIGLEEVVFILQKVAELRP